MIVNGRRMLVRDAVDSVRMHQMRHGWRRQTYRGITTDRFVHTYLEYGRMAAMRKQPLTYASYLLEETAVMLKKPNPENLTVIAAKSEIVKGEEKDSAVSKALKNSQRAKHIQRFALYPLLSGVFPSALFSLWSVLLNKISGDVIFVSPIKIGLVVGAAVTAIEELKQLFPKWKLFTGTDTLVGVK